MPNPDLVRTRSTREHRATLLHYCSANGVEGYRQKTPKNIVEIAEILLRAGADKNAEADVYGGGATTLGLVATSVHPEHAGVQNALLQTLLDHGAAIDHPRGAGNDDPAVMGCLANGRGQAAEFLANHGAALTLESAAGAGRLDVVKGFFGEDRSLKANATKAQLKKGLMWACMYGRTSVVEFLLQQGADLVAHDESGQTALHAAATRAGEQTCG
jgi:ankyrin repeat protein